MIFFNIIIFLLEVTLLFCLATLILLYSENMDLHYEEDSSNFFNDYVANNPVFPAEYTKDVNDLPKIISLIKESPEDFNDIPKEKVLLLEIEFNILNGNTEFRDKLEKISLFLGLTLFAYIISVQSLLAVI